MLFSVIEKQTQNLVQKPASLEACLLSATGVASGTIYWHLYAPSSWVDLERV